jgi:DNA-binding transcriptional LysR family regulator
MIRSVGPDLRQLRYFVAVAETLNFRRAAEELHVAQPALSKAIRQLEEQLGVPLFERTTRSVDLTTVGELFLDRARQALSSADEAFAVGRDASVGIAGRLRIGASPIARLPVTPLLLAAWTHARPGIAVHVIETATAPLLRAVGSGELDMAVAWCARESPDCAMSVCGTSRSWRTWRSIIRSPARPPSRWLGSRKKRSS